ncbi:hypothetical protein MA16_Dca002387 [Dendrobium catenatum]|uniref:Uncharacterized protein n=1 Tax=Dendrobium catenatum TaxID=906689 RepID=A0A2I0W0E0_9ASPA|nr:hypothetical protein MA16_Dca002387 [Dendrobium catenatum]
MTSSLFVYFDTLDLPIFSFHDSSLSRQVKRSIQYFLDNLLSQSPDQQQTLAKIGEDLFAIATDQPLRLPSTLTFVMKAFSTIEGFDANKERIGSGHNRYFVVPFGGKITRFRGSRIVVTVYPAVPFGGRPPIR